MVLIMQLINSSCGTLKERILLFKISTATRQNSFGVYRKFGYVPSKSFASPDLDKISSCVTRVNQGKGSENFELETNVLYEV
jgi:hypothetical protein